MVEIFIAKNNVSAENKLYNKFHYWNAPIHYDDRNDMRQLNCWEPSLNSLLSRCKKTNTRNRKIKKRLMGWKQGKDKDDPRSNGSLLGTSQVATQKDTLALPPALFLSFFFALLVSFSAIAIRSDEKGHMVIDKWGILLGFAEGFNGLQSFSVLRFFSPFYFKF